MQRRELKKSIIEFSKRTNFYELGIVRRLIKNREKDKIKFKQAIPKIKCPCCGSVEIIIDNIGSEYPTEDFLTCENCECSFDDGYGYIDAVKDYDNLIWGYNVDIEMHFNNPDINKYSWQKTCKNLILEELKDSK